MTNQICLAEVLRNSFLEVNLFPETGEFKKKLPPCHSSEDVLQIATFELRVNASWQDHRTIIQQCSEAKDHPSN